MRYVCVSCGLLISKNGNGGGVQGYPEGGRLFSF
jgi:hypothetical protein